MRVLQSQHTQSHSCKPWLGFYTGSVFVFVQYLTTVPREQLFTKQKGKSRIQWVPFSQLSSSIHKGADIRRGLVSFLPASQFKLVSCSMFWSHSLLLPYPPNSASSLLSLAHHVQFVLPQPPRCVTFHWSMANLPENLFLQKSDSPFPCIPWFPVFPQLGVRLCSSPLPMLVSSLTGSCTGLMDIVAATVGLYLQLCLCAQKTLFLFNHLPPVVFTVPSSAMIPEFWEERPWYRCYL